MFLSTQRGQNSIPEVNLIRTMKFPNSKQIWCGVPILAANMDTTGTLEMFHTLAKNRLLTCLLQQKTLSKPSKDTKKSK